MPPSDVWGILNKGDSLYVFADTTTDDGDTITGIYKGNPILKAHRRSQVKAAGIWAEESDTSTIYFTWYDMDGATISIDTISPGDRYKYWEPFLGKPSHWWQVEIKTNADECDLEIKGLDLWPRWVADPIGK
jgi:hypothetical protein